MSGGAFRVTSPCIIRGRPYRAGDTVMLDDAAEIGLLLGMGRIEGANDATSARIRTKDIVRWSKGHPADRPERPEDSLWIRRA